MTDAGHSNKRKLVRCNHADSPECAHCKHSVPHEHVTVNDERCTEWGVCCNLFGEDMKVRCVQTAWEE